MLDAHDDRTLNSGATVTAVLAADLARVAEFALPEFRLRTDQPPITPTSTTPF
jgi:hypothetical protein